MSSFRRTNIILNRGPPGGDSAQPNPALASANRFPGRAATSTPSPAPMPSSPGVRPSPIDGRPVTSTGTPSLDSLVGGHTGLPLGCTMLVEEPGSTDYGGALLRYYAAEGLVQGHAVTIVGYEQWVRELPAAVGDAEQERHVDNKTHVETERMKIAWRYERLGNFGSGIGGSRAQALPQTRSGSDSGSGSGSQAAVPGIKNTFCHAFDLTKRLTIPGDAKLSFITPPGSGCSHTTRPFVAILQKLLVLMQSRPEDGLPHRVIIPSLLNPTLYPPHAASPENLVQFFFSLRALVRQFPKRLTMMISLPTELYPRTTGMIRWAEILSDGVLELLALPRRTAANAVAGENEPQGLLKMWKVPILSEKGGGLGSAGAGSEDLAFLVTRRRFEIMAYSLPPADEEEEPHSHLEKPGALGVRKKATAVDLEF